MFLSSLFIPWESPQEKISARALHPYTTLRLLEVIFKWLKNLKNNSYERTFSYFIAIGPNFYTVEVPEEEKYPACISSNTMFLQKGQFHITKFTPDHCNSTF